MVKIPFCFVRWGQMAAKHYDVQQYTPLTCISAKEGGGWLRGGTAKQLAGYLHTYILHKWMGKAIETPSAYIPPSINGCIVPCTNKQH